VAADTLADNLVFYNVLARSLLIIDNPLPEAVTRSPVGSPCVCFVVLSPRSWGR